MLSDFIVNYDADGELSFHLVIYIDSANKAIYWQREKRSWGRKTAKFDNVERRVSFEDRRKFSQAQSREFVEVRVKI